MRCRPSLLCAAFVAVCSLLPSPAWADIKQCEQPTEVGREQMRWCVAHAGCNMVVSVMTACTDITAVVRKLYAQFHATPDTRLTDPVVSERDRRQADLDKLDSKPAAERKAALAKCLDYRGDSGTDVCYEQFAGSEEIAERKRAEQAKLPKIDWDAADASDVRDFKAKDADLVASMRDANCASADKAQFSRCFALAREAGVLRDRVARFDEEIHRRRKPGDPLLVVPVLDSARWIRPDGYGGNDFITDRSEPKPAPAAPPPPPAPAAAAPPMPDLPARTPDAFDAMIAEEVTQVNEQARPRDALEEQARQQRRARDAAAAAEAAAAAQRAQMKAAEQQAQEAADRRVLQSGSVGELFALADRLDADHQPDAARNAYRTLISRFPDHALATSAANRLSGMATAAAPAQQASAQGAPSAGASARGGNGAACDSEYAALKREAERPGYLKNSRGMIGQLQGIMALTSASVKLAAGACKGMPQEQELSAGMQQAFDGAKQNCMAIASDTSQCVPRRPD